MNKLIKQNKWSKLNGIKLYRKEKNENKIIALHYTIKWKKKLIFNKQKYSKIGIIEIFN